MKPRRKKPAAAWSLLTLVLVLAAFAAGGLRSRDLPAEARPLRTILESPRGGPAKRSVVGPLYVARNSAAKGTLTCYGISGHDVDTRDETEVLYLDAEESERWKGLKQGEMIYVEGVWREHMSRLSGGHFLAEKIQPLR
ncbi:MAG: hypothetical protein AAB576_00405 [Elusimicrobiota bacterium]